MRILRAAIAASALLLSAGPTGARESLPEATIEGQWMAQKRDGIVLIEPSGSELVGRIVWVKDRDGIKGTERLDTKNPDAALRSRHLLGLTILTGLPLEPDKKGIYRGGRVYNPKSGMLMPIRVQLETPDRLKVRVGNGLLHRTVRWTRVDSDSVSARERLGGSP